MVRLLVLDKNGHTTITENVEQEFRALCNKGYAMFVNDIQVNELPATGDVLALAPLVGG